MRRSLLCAALAVAVLAAAPPGRAQTLQSSLALPTTSLTFSAAYVADDLGLWTKQGLEVKGVIIAGVGSPNAVIAGSVDFTITTASTFLRAASRGQRMLAVANLLERPMVEVVLRKDLADAAGFDAAAPVAARARLLKGRTIAVDGIYTVIHAFLQVVALKGGLDPETEMHVAPMVAPNMPAALDTKAIDGFSASLPWTSGAVALGKAVLIASGPRGDLPELLPFAYGIVMTRPELCREHAPVCAGMVAGLAAADSFIREHPLEALAIVRKRFPSIGDEVLKPAFETLRGATAAVPRVDPAALANSERLSVEAHVVKPEDAVKVLDGLYTNDFVH
jgi:NitT/TauT family transport system substrate-binding protein